MSVLPTARPFQGIVDQNYHRGIRGNGLQVGKYALAGPHRLRERAVKSWLGPVSWADVGVDI